VGKERYKMIDHVALFEYKLLASHVSPKILLWAHWKVFTTLDIPPRGPEGDPVNDKRLNLLLNGVIREVRKLEEEERE